MSFLNPEWIVLRCKCLQRSLWSSNGSQLICSPGHQAHFLLNVTSMFPPCFLVTFLSGGWVYIKLSSKNFRLAHHPLKHTIRLQSYCESRCHVHHTSPVQCICAKRGLLQIASLTSIIHNLSCVKAMDVTFAQPEALRWKKRW